MTSDLVELTRDVVQVRSEGENVTRIELIARRDSITGEWDPDRIQQVIENLVGNALKYSPPTGKVTVTVDIVEGRAAVSVADEGPGISEADRQNIFGAFFRTTDATSSQAPGLGLGLYICRELVRAHDGTIEVVEAAGGGAEFRVLLPMTGATDAVMTPVQLELVPGLLETAHSSDVSASS